MSPPENRESATAGKAARLLAAEWLEEAEPRFVRSFSNHVYVLSPASPRVFLRITSAAHRSERELVSELQFVRFLAGRGIPVSEPLPSRTGGLVHTAELGGQTFHACAFGEAPGEEFACLSASARRAFFRLAGETMGTLHKEGRTFAAPSGFRRFSWPEDRWLRFPALIPEPEREAWRLYRELRRWTSGLSQDASVFGMVHGDFTITNMRILPGRLTLFDFDSCCRHWYGYEIAAFLHYFGAQDPTARRRVYDDVLAGYAKAASIDERTIASIPLFGKMRLLYSFLVFAEVWGFEGLSPEQERYFAVRRRLFEEDPTWPSPG